MAIKKVNIKFVVVMILVVSVFEIGALATYNIVNKPQTKVINMTAQRFRFTPSIITVNKGDFVTLRITSIDVTHGFYLDGYAIEYVLSPHIVTTISFIASTAGKFTFRCAVTCGNFHPYMIGELRVQPNSIFYSVMVLAGLITIFMVGSVYKQSKKLAAVPAISNIN